MKILLLDVDRTLCPFGPTTELYKRLFLGGFAPGYLARGALMKFCMHMLWFIPPAVRFQRRLVMTLFSRVEPQRFDSELSRVVEQIVASYRADFGPRIEDLARDSDQVVLLTQCPRPMARALVDALGFDGEWSLDVADYFAKDAPTYMIKTDVIGELRTKHPGVQLHFFADDLVDLPALRAVDAGTVVNPSWFTRLWCRLFARDLEVWK